MNARQIAMGAPQRIQRRRLKGWRAPAGAIYVGRGSKWGNPFTNADCIESGWATTVAEARKVNVEFFTAWLDGTLHGGPGPEDTSWSGERRDWIREHASELAGRDLMCWCPPGEPCHADVLIEIANRITAVSPDFAASVATGLVETPDGWAARVLTNTTESEATA